ncbi:MAG: DUF3857 domain-containing protein, partial [Opitutaceae bacterium]|nr:DUF3857 domain-containing protein [Opitutaceae bacterium]
MRHARLPVVLGLVLACMLAGAATRAPAAAPPEWLTRLAAEPTPAYAAGAPALVLFDHDAVRLDGRGRLVLTRRRAVRVLSAGGEEHAQAVITYLSGRDTAKGLGAWLLRGGKEFKPKSQSRGWVDEVIDEDALFSEYRAKTYSCEDIAAPGDVFGFEATVEGGTLFTDQINIWRSDLPALAERYDLTLSSGWTLTARVDGERPLVASRSADGLTWSWVLRDRPYRPDEPYAAEEQWFDARVLTTLQRPAGAAVVPGGPVSFSRWSELSMWNRDLAAGQCDRDPALAENVARLTAGVADFRPDL